MDLFYNGTVLTNSTTSNYVVLNTTTTTWDPPQVVRVQEAAARDEDPVAWLRRRVMEVCWKPA